MPASWEICQGQKEHIRSGERNIFLKAMQYSEKNICKKTKKNVWVKAKAP